MMKLVQRPTYYENMYGQLCLSDIKIWSPRDEASRLFEKLRTGHDIVIDVGKRYNHLAFPDEKIILYDVMVFESYGNDTFRCQIERFREWSEECQLQN